ncbi:MAG: 4-(cytidine 5'-diphospho)-2-C-methyl-D-erythritol kinase [Thermoanaerobaculia bacterium]
MRITLEAFAKVNRSLVVFGRRPDGYHEIDTLFQTIDLSDEIRFEEDGALSLSVGGIDLVEGEANLVLRAAHALSAGAGVIRGARIHLSKRIPVGAGLGGGSADAAATLLGLNSLWRFETTADDLAAIGATVGSDIPFFLYGGRARGTGRGERIEPLPDAPDERLVLLFPGFGMATPEVYRALGAGPAPDPLPPRVDSSAVPDRNDLEAAAERLRPELASLRLALLAEGALSARLSGSGSTVYGVFRGDDEARRAAAAIGRKESVQTLVTRSLSRAEWCRRALPPGGRDPEVGKP